MFFFFVFFVLIKGGNVLFHVSFIAIPEKPRILCNKVRVSLLLLFKKYTFRA